MKEKVYIAGSLRGPMVPEVANRVKAAGHDVFADWYSPGPHADDAWQEYERTRGRTYRDAIYGAHAQHVFAFDKRHLDECTVGVLVMPAGKSAHIELGYLAGTGKRTFVLFDEEPERYDLMYLFADYVCFSIDELLHELEHPRGRPLPASGFDR